MTCADFLQHYSDFRDGLVRDSALRDGLERHRRECVRCGRLVVVLDRGLAALRATHDLAPSRRFRNELQQRLRAELAIGDPVMPTHAGLAAAFLVAAAVGLMLYEGLSRPEREVAEVAASARRAEPLTIAQPVFLDVTLPPFTRSSFTLTSSQFPLGTFAVR